MEHVIVTATRNRDMSSSIICLSTERFKVLNTNGDNTTFFADIAAVIDSCTACDYQITGIAHGTTLPD